MNRQLGIFLLALGFLAASGSNESIAKQKKSSAQVVSFNGTLQDENLNVISGVFPMTFSLYKTEGSRRAIWSERVWVAVDSGRYSVNLGSRKPIPARLNLEKMYVGVSLESVGELLREPLMAQEENPVVAVPTEGRAPVAVAPTPTPRPSGKGQPDIAERAMHAFEADHATNADKIGNLSVMDLQKMFEPKKVTTGSRTRETESAGGPGGKLYELECPKGYVVTGVRGGSGKYLDSISLICSPLSMN